MAEFSLCIEPVLTDYDFYDRIRIAAALGFDAIEFWDPADRDISKIARIASESKIAVSICCVKNAWQLRMNFPADQVLRNVEESIEIAKELGCKSLIGLSGDVDGQPEMQKSTLVENLKRAAEPAGKAGITICMESLNSLVDHKGYYLDSSSAGFEIIKSVGSDNVKLLYDVYHMQIMEGNIIETIQNNIDEIGHFHSAGVPGRHEHFYGENDYGNILKAIENKGYKHYFGLEYWPTYEHKKSLADCLDYLKKYNK